MTDTNSNAEEYPDDTVDNEELNVDEILQPTVTTAEVAPIPPLGIFLTGDRSTTYSNNPQLHNSLTLRNCNTLYGQSNGCKYTAALPSEFDRCQVKGSIAPMRSFDNIIGHFAYLSTSGTEKVVSTLSFPPTERTSILEFSASLVENLSRSVTTGHLWSILGCNLYRKSTDGTWYTGNQNLSRRVSTTLTAIAQSFTAPISAHTQHAWFESQDQKDATFNANIFQEPQETTAVPSLIGTLRNNQQIDLALEQNSEQPNVERRVAMLEVPGFLCRGYTPHSNEVGRVRAVCDGVSIRVLNTNCLTILRTSLQACARADNGKKDWLLYCMGEMTYCSTKGLLRLRDILISFSSISPNAPTLYIDGQSHIVLLSVASGVLLRRDTNGLLISSSSEGADLWPDHKYCVSKPDIASEVGFDYYFSGFFKLVPYIAFDRPPRTLISSVQSVQAVASPYGAGTSSVSASHLSKPLVSTPFLEAVIDDTVRGTACNLADLLPGEDLMVCFANFNDTNEDSIMMSEGSTQRALFAHMAYSSHLLNEDEIVPEPGNYVNMDEHRWWKSYTRTDTRTKLKPNQLKAGGDGRGKIVSSTKTDAGKLSVKVLRYSTSATGDKIATGHGQKGTMKLTKQRDMPWGIDENGEQISFDIVVSVSSISNRLTTGQYYEMVSGALAAKTGRRLVITPSTPQSEHTETELYDGKSGELITRVGENGEKAIKASWGIYRVWQMTQLTWDKQHYTHRTSGPNSIVTQTGRTGGGGIRFGEMEAHSVEGSGLVESFRELKCRMDLIDTKFCCRCETFVQMCSCQDESVHTTVSVPFSMLVFSYSNLLTTGHLTKFNISF